MTDHSRSATSSVRESYDWASIDPSTAVVESVSRALDREPDEIPQLHESIDTDGLDTVVGATDGTTSVSFHYADRRVTVHGSGTVHVQDNGAACD